MRRILPLGLMALILCVSAHARLGESEAQLTKRFGPPVARSVETLMLQGRRMELCPRLEFSHDGWGITCDVLDGRCVRIIYSKEGDWTQEQFRTVLNINSQGLSWSDISTETTRDTVRDWSRDDGGKAHWDSLSKTIEVTNPAYERAIKILGAKAKAAASHVPSI